MKNTKRKGVKKDKVGLGPKEEGFRADFGLKVGLFVVSFILAVVIINFDIERDVLRPSFEVGEPSPRTVYSPFTVSYIDEAKTLQVKEINRENVPYVFARRPEVKKNIEDEVNEFLSLVKERKSEPEGKLSVGELNIRISEDALDDIWDYEDIDAVKRAVLSEINDFLSRGIISEVIKNKLLDEGEKQVLIQNAKNKDEKGVYVREINSLEEAREEVGTTIRDKFPKNRELRRIVNELTTALLRPNLVLDAEATKKKEEEAYEKTPPVDKQIKKDEVVVVKGRIILPQDIAKLDAIYKKFAERRLMTALVGTSLVILLVFGILFVYLYYFEKRLFRSTKMLLLVNTIIILTLLIEKIIVSLPATSFYLMPAAFASLLLAILIRPRLGIIGALVICVFNGLLANYRFDVVLYSLLGAVSGSYATIGIRRRSTFIKVGFIVGLVNFCVIFGYQILNERVYSVAWYPAMFGFVNALVIAIPLLFLTLPMFEYLFGLITNITLLELSDLNHPLLKRMIIEAPGTYHHSLIVSSLAESACEAIGANGLLARVGCYFHDIGKIAKSEYFTENRRYKEPNVHENLIPSMSFLIIGSHVKEGIELARKYKLNEAITNFIPEHHGTGIVYYFYKKAIEKAKEGEKVTVDDFRYTGPKPQSKETAVALLADSVEAASRTASDLSPGAIRGLVKKIINDRFIDGQLSECDLTVKDLYKIEESFTRSLAGIYHTRVEYPSDTDEQKEKKKNQNGKNGNGKGTKPSEGA